MKCPECGIEPIESVDRKMVRYFFESLMDCQEGILMSVSAKFLPTILEKIDKDEYHIFVKPVNFHTDWYNPWNCNVRENHLNVFAYSKAKWTKESLKNCLGLS